MEHSNEPTYLTVIIPAYNERARLPGTLREVADYLQDQSYASEILVVDDGSTDGNSEAVEVAKADIPHLSLLSTEHRGKGYAVRTGMLASKGQHRFICDADLSMPIHELGKFLPPALTDWDVAAGSREAPGAVRYDEPSYRHLMGRVFNLVVKLLAVRGIEDTQCGFKCFTAEAADSVFPHQIIDGWGFDVEALFIAQKQGLRIVEVPIDWFYRADSRVQPISDAAGMLGEVLKVRWNDLRGRYPNRRSLATNTERTRD
ncbi:MAG: dolichyl-phosphate beta-glucosyltransferase [Anaerolineae bacterium]